MQAGSISWSRPTCCHAPPILARCANRLMMTPPKSNQGRRRAASILLRHEPGTATCPAYVSSIRHCEAAIDDRAGAGARYDGAMSEDRKLTRRDFLKGP